jgi:hypothetical protein
VLCVPPDFWRLDHDDDNHTDDYHDDHTDDYHDYNPWRR